MATERRTASRRSARRRRGSRSRCACPSDSGPRGDLQRRPHRRARRDPGRDSLAAASARAVSIASSSVTGMISSITSRFRIGGTNPAPIPWMRCGPGWPPESTGEPAGSTATTRTSGIALLQHLAHARDRPARADGRHEHVHAAVQVGPDLLGGRAPVHLRVGRVLELLGNEGVRRSRAPAASPRRPPRACRPSTRSRSPPLRTAAAAPRARGSSPAAS